MYGYHARQAWKQGNLSKERKNFENYLVESAEVAMLRLVVIFLEDAPIVVLNLTELIKTPPSKWTDIQGEEEDVGRPWRGKEGEKWYSFLMKELPQGNCNPSVRLF